jgi:hypothetical protein
VSGAGSGVRRLGSVLFITLLFAVGSTAHAAQNSPSACRAGQQARLMAELTFGRDIGRRIGVGKAAWRRFLDHEVTPRFPDGLTVVSALGQWRDRRTGKIVREPGKLVIIVLPGNPDDQARLDAIAAAYKRLFRQQSVGVIVQPACTAF